MIEPQAFFDDGNQYIDRDGDPDLSLHGIVAGAIKGLDAKVLLDPLEEQFDLPATSIQLSDGQRRQGKIVGQKNQSLVGLLIEVNGRGAIFRDSPCAHSSRKASRFDRSEGPWLC